jgi:hypothetical protein
VGSPGETDLITRVRVSVEMNFSADELRSWLCMRHCHQRRQAVQNAYPLPIVIVRMSRFPICTCG